MQELATGYGLIEGPVWDPAKGLYFSDVLGGGIYLLDRAGEVSLAVPKRRGVGGLALHADGGLIASGRDIVHVSLADHSMRVLLAQTAADGAVGFNDLTTDAAGRVYVGSIAFAVFKAEELKPGNLYVIDGEGKARQISDGILLTNGLGFSPDGRRLYHSDALRELIRVYDVDEDGSVGHWRAFAATGARQRARRPQGRRRRLRLGGRCPQRPRRRVRTRRAPPPRHRGAAPDGDQPVLRRR